jgi:hypothetical protein
MAVNLSPVGGAAAQFFDNNGIPLSGGLLYTYAAGTSTPLATYTTQQATVANSNPIVLDSAGRVPNEIWLQSTYSYKFVLTNSLGAQVWSYDNLVGINSNFTAYALQEQTFTATQGQTVFTLSGIQYVPATNNLSVFVNGSKQIVSTNYIETSSTVVTFTSGLNVGDVVDFITAISTSTSATSAANISYNEGEVGAVTTNVQTKLQQYVSVKDFGALGDGTTDDTVAMQAAHTTGKLVYYPAGTYKCTSGITIASGGIIGAGQSLTVINSTDTTSANIFKYTGQWVSPTFTNAPLFRDFQLKCSTSKTSGAGIQVLPTSGESSYLFFENINFLNLPIGIDFVAASLWKVIGCNFLAYTIAGCQVANTNVADSGDSVISDCVFNNPYTTGSGVFQKSSGGLRILGCKFLGGLHGYTLNLNATTSNLMIVGNSFENMTGEDISLAQITASTTFQNITISGNEFGVGAKAIATDASNFITEMSITGNVINMGATGSNASIGLSTITDFVIDGNVFRSNSGVGSSAISLTSCTNGKIGVNTYSRLPNPIAIFTSTDIFVTKDAQQGTSTTATSGWSAYGSLYQSPTTTVTFTTPFLIAPVAGDIQLVAAASSGEVSAIVISVSKTNFTYKVISVNTSIAAVINWKAFGTL